jgi:hypothetical protein
MDYLHRRLTIPKPLNSEIITPIRNGPKRKSWREKNRCNSLLKNTTVQRVTIQCGIRCYLNLCSIFQSRTDLKGRFGSDFECDLEICMQFQILFLILTQTAGRLRVVALLLKVQTTFVYPSGSILIQKPIFKQIGRTKELCLFRSSNTSLQAWLSQRLFPESKRP